MALDILKCPVLWVDGYKTGHHMQYPEGTEFVYSNFTPRSSKHFKGLPDYDQKVVVFGLQGVIKNLLIEQWNEHFFKQDVEEICYEYQRIMDGYLGPKVVGTEHIRNLHSLDYLPIHIKALREGSRVPVRIAHWTIENTVSGHGWLTGWVTNYLETQLSAELWKPLTSATTAYEFRRLFDKFAEMTGVPKEFVDFQGHDFSHRGMSNNWDAIVNGAAHLTSFKGTDTVPAILYHEKYYGAKNTFVGGSVPATEHSVMCAGGMEDEKETIRRLIQDVYPSGIISIVSDTWDFWNVISKTALELKPIIMARDGKVVFRPDSGNPADIICGDIFSSNPNIYRGAVEVLWNIFGGTINEKGYKVLDPHVGLIYGDGISLEVANDILTRLEAKGFASSNIVFGIGSYTYQFVTRDTFGCAIKATHAVVNGESFNLFKDPKTDDGMKKSAKGLIRIEIENGEYVQYDEQTREQSGTGELITVFVDSVLCNETNLEKIRNRLSA